MSTVEKEKLYKTAYSPMDNCFVSIQHAHQDKDGNWIFKCTNKEFGILDCLYREYQLRGFTL